MTRDEFEAVEDSAGRRQDRPTYWSCPLGRFGPQLPDLYESRDARCRLYLDDAHSHSFVCDKFVSKDHFGVVEICMRPLFRDRNHELFSDLKRDLKYHSNVRELAYMEQAEFIFHSLRDLYVMESYKNDPQMVFYSKLLDLTNLSSILASEIELQEIIDDEEFCSNFRILHFYLVGICHYCEIFPEVFTQREQLMPMEGNFKKRLIKWINTNTGHALESLLYDADEFFDYPEMKRGIVSWCTCMYETIRKLGGIDDMELPSPKTPKRCSQCGWSCGDSAIMCIIDCCGFLCFDCFETYRSNQMVCDTHKRVLGAWTAVGEIIGFRRDKRRRVINAERRRTPPRLEGRFPPAPVGDFPGAAGARDGGAAIDARDGGAASWTWDAGAASRFWDGGATSGTRDDGTASGTRDARDSSGTLDARAAPRTRDDGAAAGARLPSYEPPVLRRRRSKSAVEDNVQQTIKARRVRRKLQFSASLWSVEFQQQSLTS